MPQSEVVKYPFGLFSSVVVLAVVLVIFCVVYLYIRKKGRPPQVDKKAGDEGED